jgi:hypothetical protein
LIFGDPRSIQAGIGTRLVGSAIGAGLGHVLGLGPVGEVAGTSLGGVLPEAVNKVNAGIASRIGTSAADANLTAEAIQRFIAKQPKSSQPQLQNLLGNLLLGSQATVPSAMASHP